MDSLLACLHAMQPLLSWQEAELISRLLTHAYHYYSQVLQDLSTYPEIGQIVAAADEQQDPVSQEQLEQHICRPADVICALNFSVFLLSSR